MCRLGSAPRLKSTCRARASCWTLSTPIRSACRGRLRDDAARRSSWLKTMNVTARGRNGVHEFDGGPNERLLHAGLRQGIALPYECGTGTCGTCKAKLISGKVRDSWPSAPGAKSL